MDYQSLLGAFGSGPRSAYDAMANAGARTAVRGMIPPGQDWQSRRSNAGLRASAMGEAAARFQQLPDIPGPAPGWRDQKLDQLLAGGAPGVHHGAFGGRSVQIPGGQYRVHPMAVNSAPMAPMSQPAGDPGLWYNQTPQPFNARGYVDANSQRINAGQMRAVANMLPDGGVQLRGGGQYMDPVRAAQAYAQMGGKGLTFNNAGQPMLNGNVMDGQGMFQANMDLRKSMASSREGNIRNNRRVNRALFRAQHYGDMGPLWKAVGDGLIKMPDQGQGNAANQNRGADFMMNAALGMMRDLPPHQAAAMLGPMARAMASGNLDDFDAVARNVSNAQARNAETRRSATAAVPTVQPGDILRAKEFATGDEAFDYFSSQGWHKNRSVAVTKRAFPDWNPRWAGMFDYTDPEDGEVKNFTNKPWLSWVRPDGPLNPMAMFGGGGGASAPGPQPAPPQPPQAGPQQPGQGGMMGGMFRNFWGAPDGPVVIPEQAGQAPPQAQPRLNPPPGDWGSWLQNMGHRFLGQRW